LCLKQDWARPVSRLLQAVHETLIKFVEIVKIVLTGKIVRIVKKIIVEISEHKNLKLFKLYLKIFTSKHV
jgi:hypothetical protein